MISKASGRIVSEGAQGLLILTGISVVVAIGAHRALCNFVIACAVAAVVSTILFGVASSVHSGFVDPFWPIAVVVGGGYAFVAARWSGQPSASGGAGTWQIIRCQTRRKRR